jgi:hypothetical protein
VFTVRIADWIAAFLSAGFRIANPCIMDPLYSIGAKSGIDFPKTERFRRGFRRTPPQAALEK